MITYIKACFFEFNTVSEGVQVMQNTKYPCAFVVNSDIYDYQGNLLIYPDLYFTVHNNIMEFISGEGDEYTSESTLYVQNNICKINKSRL